MENNSTWYFPPDNSGQFDGFNDSGIETFLGNPICHLAREINQNALDAGNGNTVDVKFIKRVIETSEIPNFEELKRAFVECSEIAEQDGAKTKIFFKNALNLLNQSKISVLEISDYNTTGIEGPCILEKPYFAFMKASGQSRKSSETATGSYGIGKYAPYAISKFRTIFVSTTYKGASSYEQLTQGKAILISHYQDGTLRRGTGFWGIKSECQPLSGISKNIPQWIQREEPSEDTPKEPGSKITILCFDEQDSWRERLSVHIAKNFFGAINAGKLRVNIDNCYFLEKLLLPDFFKNETLLDFLQNDKDSQDEFEACINYFKTLQKDENIETEHTQSQLLGLCELKILIRENLPKKVCILRNGMFITESLPGLIRFSDFKDFVAVIQCKDKAGNALLRSMEPPRHDSFEPDRLPELNDRKKGRKALKDLAQWIRDKLKKHARDPVSDITTIDELSEFFGEDVENGSGSGTEELDPFGDIVIKPRAVKQKTGQSSGFGDGLDGDDGDGSEGGGGDKGAGGGDGKGGTGPGEGGTGGGTKKSLVNLMNVRATTTDKKRRTISFTPVTTGTIAVKAFQVGADADFNISIKESTAGAIENGTLKMDVKNGERKSIIVEFDNEFSGAIKVVAYEI